MAERVIGVDVGGTKVSIATLEGGTLSAPVVTPTERASGDDLIDQLVTLIADAGRADAVGLGIPGVIEFATGMVRSAVNVPLQGVALRELLSERLEMPAFVDNDATVAALAEAYDDDLEPVVRSLFMVTVGTGVGGGAIIDGHVYRGATGAAPELGHIIVAADLTDGAPPRPARFPDPHSLEHFASGRALDRLGEERGIGDGNAVVSAAQAGDAEAADCLRILGERLGVGIANVVNLLEPDLVVIGGGVSRAGALLLDPAREAAHRFLLPGLGTQTKIELARYGPQAGVRGAALLARLELERRPEG